MPIFMQLIGLTGDVTTSPYSGFFDCLSISWGEVTAVSASGVGKAVPSQIEILRNPTQGSPSLFLHSAEGTRFATGKLVMTKATSSGAVPYLELDLTNIYIGSWSIGGETPPLTEVLTLYFQSLTYTQHYTGTTGQDLYQSAVFNFGTP